MAEYCLSYIGGLQPWAWNMDSGIAIQRILEYINAHPELWGAFTSVDYTLSQITDQTVHGSVMAKYNKLKFLDEQCALNYPTIRRLLAQDNYGDLIGMTYNFYFQNGESLEARDFIKYYLDNFEPGVSDQFSQYILYWNSVPSFLSGTLGLDPNSTDYLANLSWLRRNIGDYNKITEFYNVNSQDATVKTYILQMVKMLRSGEGYLCDRFLELFNIVKNDHLALVKPCLSGNPNHTLSEWEDLIRFTPNQSIINYLANFTPRWEIQSINDAYGRFANLDEYKVKINLMPLKGNGSRYTDAELVEYIRLTWNQYINTQQATYNPLDQIIDGSIWTSGNPVNARIYIDIQGFDDGTVVCAQKEPNFWVFSTIKGEYTGLHPVSGNRQFGISTDGQGNKYFFTKGADRASNFINDYFYEFLFHFASNQWISMQNGISAFINNHGGSATIIEPFRSSPNWGAIKNALKGQNQISSIPCN